MILIADSGSTKTDWRLAGGGSDTKCMVTQGINPFHQDETAIRKILNDELAVQTGDADIDKVFFYGSGCRDEFVPMMTDILRHFFPKAATVETCSDLLGAARAVCGHSEGIACILGTGSNSCLYDGSRILMNTPPLGYILGDEGSGAVLGRLFINAIFKDVLDDGLRKDFLTEYGMTMTDIIRRTYREPMANRFLASIAPFIHRHMGNRQLRSLVTDSFRAFFRLNVAPYGRRELAVGAVGSIAHYFATELSEAARDEGFRMGRIIKSPIDGLLEYHADRHAAGQYAAIRHAGQDI